MSNAYANNVYVFQEMASVAKATLVGGSVSKSPLIICFHGSGDSCASWSSLVNLLKISHHVLLWNRGPENPKPATDVEEMLAYLSHSHLSPPYVLIAHSYGGIFARTFLQKCPKSVAAMVLAETGQETALDPKVEQQQYKKRIFGDKPLVVIRGNTLIAKWREYEQALSIHEGDASANASLIAQKQLLEVTDREDERLKKSQMALSRNSRYVHVPDCGHNIIQDRPDVVVEQVCWVMENLETSTKNTSTWTKVRAWMETLKKRV